MKNSEEEENYIITDMDWIKDFKEDIKKYQKIGETLNDTLIRIKILYLSEIHSFLFNKLIKFSGLFFQ